MGKVGGPRVFFDVLGAFNAHRLIKDYKAQSAVMESIVLDSIDSIIQSMAGFSTVIDNMVQSTIHVGLAVGTAIVEFEKFAGENERLQAEIIQTGESLGFTADEALRAGAKMAQLSAIFGEATTAAATRLGQEFALISSMGTEEAMKGLINLQQQTGFMYGSMTQDQYRLLDAQDQRNTAVLQSTEFLDEMNTVENKSAATMKQMIFVMNQFAAQANTTGESIANMAAMSATLIEAGEEQGKAGRALRMIYARLGSNIQDNNELLAEFGIEAKDAVTGGVRPLSAILADLAEIYPDLNAEQKQNISQTVAGNDHYVRFTKLIENYSRFSELATDAVYNQSTAQAELNRVLESNTTKYKEAQARLENLKSEIGQGLLPTMTTTTNMQSRLIEGFLEFENVGGMALLGTIVKLREYGRILGGVFDMYLQMKSVNISMAVHESILKAIAGQEIVRTDSYRKQGIFSGITTSNTKELSLIMHEIALIEDAIKMHKTAQQPLDEARSFQAAKVAQMRERQEIVESKLLDLQTRSYHKLQAQAAAYEEAGMLANTLMQTDMIHGEMTVGISNELMKQVAAKRNELGLSRSLQSQQELELKLAMAKLSVSKRELSMEEIKNLKYAPASAKQLAVELEGTKAIVSKQAEELSLLESIIQKQYQLRMAKYARMSAEERLNDLTEEQLFLFQNLGMEESELMRMDAMHFAALTTEIALLDDKNEKLRQQQIEQIKANYETYRAIAAGRTLSTEVQRMNTAFNKFSMAAGLASMALGVFGDDVDSAQASVVLMTASMIPAIMQMSQMSVGMMHGAQAAQMAASGATALTLTLKGLATTVAIAVPLGIVAFAIAKLINATKEADDTFGDLNDTLRVSQNLLKSISDEQAQAFDVPAALDRTNRTLDLTTMTMSELAHESERAKDKLAELRRDQQSFAEDDPLYGMLQNDINELQTYKTTLDQVRMSELGKDLLALDDPESKLQALADMIAKEGLDVPGADIRFADAEATLSPKVVTSTIGGDIFTDVQMYEDVLRPPVDDIQTAIDLIQKGELLFADMTQEGRKYFMAYINALEGASAYAFDDHAEGISDMGEKFTEAEEKMRAFANAREELFFGGKSSYMSGDMMKQVVNKGVENLYSNVELIMTNNFYGLTFEQAVDTISDRIVGRLVSSGVPMNSQV